MKVAVLIDKNPHPVVSLLTEFGMSIYFEADGYKCLLDVGASEQFATNADNMGIDIADIDFLVISHGHIDHTGGLTEFLQRNKKAKIFLSSHIKGKMYFANKPDVKHDISIDYSIVEKHLSRFVFVDTNQQISKNIALISRIPSLYSTPKANKMLTILDQDGERADDFKDEIVLSVNTDKGLVVFSGCSHNGILNILASCSDVFNSSKVIACVGGTHLIDSDVLLESEDELTEIGMAIIHSYPHMRLITGHCTGINAQRAFSTIMNERFKVFHSGMFLEV